MNVRVFHELFGYSINGFEIDEAGGVWMGRLGGWWVCMLVLGML